MDNGSRHAKRELTALRSMSIRQSITVGEALLTSDVMRVIRPVKGPRPPSVAAALGISRRRSNRT